jgi:two-component system nitrate/nitrite response regulator NarL
LIRVAIVDDHPILRDGLVHTFAHQDGFEVVGQGGTAEEAIQIAEMALPDLLLLDLNMPGDGIHAARAISQSCPAVRIIVLTAHDGEEHVLKALRSGASAYVVKGVSSEELVKTARAVHGGEAYVSPALAAKLLRVRSRDKPRNGSTSEFVDLTLREEQILRLVCEGQSNREIGETIGVSEKTVKHYMTNILQKLHARNRVEAALIASRRLGE